MKLISSVLGTAAIRASTDEILPKRGISQRVIIEWIASRYAFNLLPPSGLGVPPQHILKFQSGLMIDDSGEQVAINELSVFPDGAAVVAKETNLANVVLDHLLSGFDSELDYHFRSSDSQKLYLSQVVVEFDRRFTEQTRAFSTIQSLLNARFPERTSGFRLKRLGFGSDLNAEPQSMLLQAGIQVPSVDNAIIRDFTIERRVAEPLEKNRFFCLAPLPTDEHLEFLARMEHAVVVGD